jgi:pyroglutamyl-peptidase
VSTVVVAAFEPFGGRRRNRARDAARRIDRSPIIVGDRAHDVVVEELPTSFAPLPARLAALVGRPTRALVLVGESAAARTLLVERIALNLADARIADNEGAQPRAVPLVADPSAPLALAVRADVARLVAAAEAAGAPAAPSAHAGTFCCNAALYHALWLTRAQPLPVAFVHVPARFPWANDRRAARGLRAIATALAAMAIPVIPVEECAPPHG